MNAAVLVKSSKAFVSRKTMNATLQEVEDFLAGWDDRQAAMRNCFKDLYQTVAGLEGVMLQFVARPGVSYSLRPRHQQQQGRDLFAMIDVIDDDPAARWLSVCFYQDMISDPEERGEIIPGGLAGSDGYCFDLYQPDQDALAYLRARLREAGQAAARTPAAP